MTVKDVMNNKEVTNTISKKIGGKKIEIKTCIDVDTFANIVNTTATSCFDENGMYCSWNREIAKRYSIIKYMTNIEVVETDINNIFSDTQAGDWYDIIERTVTNIPIWAELETAIDNQIDYLITTRKSSFDILCDSLSAITTENLDDKLSDVKEVLNGINKVDKEAFVKATIKNAKKSKK